MVGINTSKKNSPKLRTVLYCTNLNGGKQYYKEKQSIFIIELYYFSGGQQYLYYKEKQYNSPWCTVQTSMVGIDTSKSNGPNLLIALY